MLKHRTISRRVPLKTANPGTIRIREEINDFDDGSSRIKRLREVSTFEYELR
jgi:uncharacterized protein